MHNVLLVTREGFRSVRSQRSGGSNVFVERENDATLQAFDVRRCAKGVANEVDAPDGLVAASMRAGIPDGIALLQVWVVSWYT